MSPRPPGLNRTDHPFPLTTLFRSPPVIVSNGGGPTATLSMGENGTAVTTVVATDADVGTVIGYSISGGADAAKFRIDGATGALAFLSAPNFEAAGEDRKSTRLNSSH